MTVFGTFVTRGHVEVAVQAHVSKWMPLHIAAVERQEGIAPGSIQLPGAVDIVTQFTRFPDDKLPWIAVVSPGIVPGRAPRRAGDGEVTAWWQVAVGAVVAAKDERAAKNLAGYYGAAIRLLMTQKASLGGFAQATDWTDESYTDVPRLQDRNLAGVRMVFVVEVHNVMNVRGGYVPTQPPEDPYVVIPDNPTVVVGGVSVDIDRKP